MPSNEEEEVSNSQNKIGALAPAIEIKTGDYKKYENKSVLVAGIITETSGNTFYIDDGSGAAKIYIQEKTGIDKPEMKKGDTFKIVGIVDLFGTDNWRILPQKKEDIKLVKKVASQSTAKATSKKKISAKAETPKKELVETKAESQKTKEPEILGQQKAIDDRKENAASEPFWSQLNKVLLGFALILFVIFVLKIAKSPRSKIRGDFSDE